MVDQTKGPPTRDEVAELDRKAWNLPQPLSPVAPVREVWPVDEEATASERPPERPAGARIDSPAPGSG